MEESGYSRIYIYRFKREINRILSMAPTQNWSSYMDIYLGYTKSSSSKAYLQNKRTIIGAIEQFDVFGRYPNGRRRHELYARSSYVSLSEEFKSIIDCYVEVESKRGIKASTIYTESHNAATFLLSLQEKGINALGEISEEAVLGFFISTEGTKLRGCSYKKNIAAVFKACEPFFHDGSCLKVLSFLPAFRERRKNIQYLTPEEIVKIKAALSTEESPLTIRDKAVGLLALYTGLRCCDIAGMTMDSIDWSKDIIRIKQQKTDIPLELPMTAVVGNAIFDYITMERPKTGLDEIFLSQSRPYGALKSTSLSNVANKIMKVADIRQEKGSRRGFHIFRHHLATALLGNGIPQPVISRVLGHTSPDSLDAYLSADFPHLKECSLSVESFPLRKEVIQ
jgi:integrase